MKKANSDELFSVFFIIVGLYFICKFFMLFVIAGILSFVLVLIYNVIGGK